MPEAEHRRAFSIYQYLFAIASCGAIIGSIILWSNAWASLRILNVAMALDSSKPLPHGTLIESLSSLLAIICLSPLVWLAAAFSWRRAAMRKWRYEAICLGTMIVAVILTMVPMWWIWVDALRTIMVSNPHKILPGQVNIAATLAYGEGSVLFGIPVAVLLVWIMLRMARRRLHRKNIYDRWHTAHEQVHEYPTEYLWLRVLSVHGNYPTGSRAIVRVNHSSSNSYTTPAWFWHCWVVVGGYYLVSGGMGSGRYGDSEVLYINQVHYSFTLKEAKIAQRYDSKQRALMLRQSSSTALSKVPS